MKKLSFIFLLTMLVVSTEANACFCEPTQLTDHFQRAQFVAKARILKVTPDPANEDYHDAEIELIALYKGERLTKIKIASMARTSCSFMPAENTTWLIFASVWNGILNFGMCSGSIQTDVTFGPITDTRVPKRFAKHLALQQEVLEYLRDNKIDPNPHHLRLFIRSLESLKGYKNKTNFAVFQVEINTDLSIAGIKVLKKFQNGRLNRAVLKAMKTNTTIKTGKNKLTRPVQITVFCYFQEKEGAYESFVSTYRV